MPIIPTSRGNPQASDVAVEVALPMTGNSVREDAQSTLALNDAEVAKLYEDRNAELSQGGLISFSGGSVTFTEILTLEINSRISGAAPVVIPLDVTFPNAFSGPFAVAADGDMVYAVIDRIAGTAVVTDSATVLPAVNAANQEVWLIGKRNDAADGTKRFYFRDGTGISSGQTIRLGAGTGTVVPAGFIQMTGSVLPAAGYLSCDGTAYDVSAFPDLAAALFDTGTGLYAYGQPPAVDATYTGTIAGTATPVTLNAVTPGAAGNSINLTFTNIVLDENIGFNTTDDLTTSSDWISQGFIASASAAPTKAILELNYVGAQPTGTMTVQIYTSVLGVPGTLLGTSNTVNCSTLSPTHTPVNFLFTSGPVLTASTSYCLVLNTSGAGFGIGSGIVVSVDNPSSFADGSYADSTDGGGTWNISALTTAFFELLSEPSINDEIAAWNTANPSNQVTLFSGDGTQIPSNGANAQLAGGFDSGDRFNVPNINGMFTRGWTGPGNTNDPDKATRFASNPGGNTGDNIGSQQFDGMSEHEHLIRLFGNPGFGGVGEFVAPTGQFAATIAINSISGNTTVTTENRPINVSVNYIIKF